MKHHRLLALALAASLCGCAMHGPRLIEPSIQPGMTVNDLTEEYGPPVRIVRHADRRETWYYKFGTQTHEEHPVSTTRVSDSERSHTVGHESTTVTTTKLAPVHFSRHGEVIGPIPAGHVIVDY